MFDVVISRNTKAVLRRYDYLLLQEMITHWQHWFLYLS